MTSSGREVFINAPLIPIAQQSIHQAESRNMSQNKDVLDNMFSSFLERKSRSPIARAHFGSRANVPRSRALPTAVPFLLNPSVPSQGPAHLKASSSQERSRGEKRKHDTGKPTSNGGRASGESSRLPRRKSKVDKAGSKMSSSAKEKHEQRTTKAKQNSNPHAARVRDRVDSSVRPGPHSIGSVEAIAVDSTSVPAPFHCEKCSKAFRQRSQLSRHFSRVHERQKPFSCAHCEKRFASAFDRKRHVEAVHGRRCIEFFCDRCSFRSKVEADLTKHIREVHERDQCRLCGKVFKRPANLVAHERHYHKQMS